MKERDNELRFEWNRIEGSSWVSWSWRIKKNQEESWKENCAFLEKKNYASR